MEWRAIKDILIKISFIFNAQIKTHGNIYKSQHAREAYYFSLKPKSRKKTYTTIGKITRNKNHEQQNHKNKSNKATGT